MEDVRLGRKTMYRCSSFTATTVPAYALPFDANRVAIRFSTNHASAIALLIAGSATDGQLAMAFSNAGGSQVFDIQRDGAITMAPFALAASATCTVYVIETLLEDR